MTTESQVFLQAMAAVRKGRGWLARARSEYATANDLLHDARRDLADKFPTRTVPILATTPCLRTSRAAARQVVLTPQPDGRLFYVSDTPPRCSNVAGETAAGAVLLPESPGRLSLNSVRPPFHSAKHFTEA